MIYGARELRALCKVGGVPVTFGTGIGEVSTYPDTNEPVLGLLDNPTQFKLMDAGAGGVAAGLPELRLPFNAFVTMPNAGDTITVDGTTYTVSPPTAEDDGAFLCYQLHEVE